MARTPMARLPWLIRTQFLSPYGNSDSSRKQLLREIIMKMTIIEGNSYYENV